jgi:Rieske Fe-S protein
MTFPSPAGAAEAACCAVGPRPPLDRLENLLAAPSRRRFLRTLFVSAAAGVAGRSTVLAAVNPASGNAILRLPLASFPTLLPTTGFASVRLGLAGTSTVLKPVFVNRDAGVFSVFTSECTHASCTVGLYNATTRRGTCPCHGSVFSGTGARISGPANRALPPYAHELNGETLLIELPEVPAYDVTVQAVVDGQPQRVALAFEALRNFDYQVLARSAVDGAWAPRAYSATPGGATTTNAFRAPGGPATLYVERAAEAEFFAISLAARTL